MNTENLLLIFTRNPEWGKCKTRLAATVGNDAALDIYKFLLSHTVKVTQNLDCTKEVHYSVKVRDNDIWDNQKYIKKQQKGENLGERMQYAFEQGFNSGYKNIIIIGSDLYDITQKDIETAFHKLKTTDYVIGPAEDGGYYLLGMNKLNPELFQNKDWGTASVFQKTIDDLQDKNYQLIETKNDVDYYEDIKNIEIFQQFLTHINV